MKKKILVMYARYGSGHKSIAEYVSRYIEDNNNYEVMLFDMTDYANFVGRCGVRLFDFAYKYCKKGYAIGYKITNYKFMSIGNVSFLKKSYDNKNLRQKISEFNPDIVISTHFYCSNIIGVYNDLGLINAKLITIITDYHTHEWWSRNHTQQTAFIVGNDIVKQELISRGVPAKKIYPFGIPLNNNKLEELDNRENILKRYNLLGNRKIYLFYGGGGTAGSMHYFEYFKTLAKLKINADIIFISGRSNELKKKCENYIKEKNINNIKILGFTTDGLNLMKISDMVITKPGGAIVTECLEMHRSMMLIPGIGGQEKHNAKFIARKKYGIKVNGLWSFKRNIKRLENNPEIIIKMNERLAKLEENKAVKKINDLIKKM